MKLKLIFLIIFFMAAPSLAQKSEFLQLVASALESDPEYANKKSELRVADINLTASNALFLPDLTLSASQVQTGEQFFKQETKYQNYLVNSQLNLFKFGGDWSARRSAKSFYDSREAALLEYQIQFESNFTEGLFNFLGLKRQLQIKTDQLASQKKLLEIASQRYQRGYLARQEVDKLSIDLDFIESELSDVKNKLGQQTSELQKRVSTLPVNLDWPWSEIADRRPQEKFQVEEHPSYLARSKVFDSSVDNYDQSASQFWGSLDLNLQWLRSNQINNEFSNESAAYLTFTIPLFNRMKDWSARKISFEKKSQAENSLRQIKENLIAQHQQAAEVLENQLQSFKKRTLMLKTSRALLTDNEARFRQGRISANELSIDQNRVYQAEQIAVNSMLNVHVSLKDVCKTLGKVLKDCLRD